MLDAYTAGDLDQAHGRLGARRGGRRALQRLFRELLTYMMGDPRTITACAHLLFVAKNLERIGDHATNIAEIIHYEITGEEMVGDRPQAGTASRRRDLRRDQAAVTPYVLVVEDEDALATLLQYNLDKEGYRVAVAADGEEALMLIDERLPDLVVLDWMLPKVSGIEVCRRLRAQPETRNLPIIMLTARGEETDRIRGLDTGADDYVVKPFSMTELAARIRAVLRRIRPGLAEDRLRHGDIVDRPRRPPGAARRQGDPPGPHRVPPARLSDAAPRPGVLAASSCWTRSGARTSMSRPAPSTCTSAACARR